MFPRPVSYLRGYSEVIEAGKPFREIITLKGTEQAELIRRQKRLCSAAICRLVTHSNFTKFNAGPFNVTLTTRSLSSDDEIKEQLTPLRGYSTALYLALLCTARVVFRPSQREQ